MSTMTAEQTYPVGTRFTFEGSPRVWELEADGQWHTDGGYTLHGNYLERSSVQGRFTVLTEPGAEQPTTVTGDTPPPDGAPTDGHSHTADYPVGACYRNTSYVNVVIQERRDGQIRRAVFRHNLPTSERNGAVSAPLGTLIDTPAYVREALPHLYATPTVDTPESGTGWDERVTALQSQVETLRENLRVSTAAQVDFRGEVQEALHTYLAEQSGLTYSEKEGIQDLLSTLGLDRWEETEEKECTITVTGHSSFYMDEQAAEHIGGGVNVDMLDRFEVEWTRDFEVTKTVSSDSCPHDDMNRSDVAALLSEAGITNFNSFEWECGTCG